MKKVALFIFIFILIIGLSGCIDNSDGVGNGEDSSFYELKITTEGEGTTDPEPGTHEFEKDSSVSIEAISHDGYTFSNWEGDYPEGNYQSTPIDILMNDDKELTAVFEEIPDSKTYSGEGDDVLDIERPGEQENFLIYIEGNQAEEHFSVNGLDSNDDNTRLFVNTTEHYEGLTLSNSGSYTNPTEKLEITAAADDQWLIEVKPIEEIEVISPPESYNGSGDYVFKIDSSISNVTIEGNSEEDHFSVTAYDENFDNQELLVNTTEYYEGEVSVDSDMRYFEVKATDDWEFEF